MLQKSLVPILIILLIALAVGGYLMYSAKTNLPQRPIACTQEAKVCPDGTSVGRSGPKCEFTPCPSAKIEDPQGKFCGGIAGNLPENQCPAGYKCKMDGNYPDAGGTCVKQ